MENKFDLFKSISGDDFDSEKLIFENAFGLLKEDLLKTNELDSREINPIAFLIKKLLLKKSYSNYILTVINENIKHVKGENAFTKFLACVLVNASELETIQKILFKVFENDNFYLKYYLFDYGVVYPIPKIFQTNECKKAIISFINSEKFMKYYQEKCKPQNFENRFYIFPSQYFNCFDIKSFNHEFIKEIPNYKLSKLATYERLESIRVIQDDFFKLELIQIYYTYYFENLYRTRFIRLVDKNFPDLKLKDNGYSRCFKE